MRETLRKIFKCDLSKLNKTDRKNKLKVGQQKLLKLKHKDKKSPPSPKKMYQGL